MMKTIDESYKELLKTILEKGVKKSDRTGTGTISMFGYQMSHNMQDGFPILTTKKVHWKSVVTELLWFLRGDTDVKFLVDNNCNIWNGDLCKKYNTLNAILRQGSDVTNEEFTKMLKDPEKYEELKKRGFTDLGPIYGKQWSNQFDAIINELTKNPDSRRLLIDSWTYSELGTMVLPPCHYAFQLWSKLNDNGQRELSLMFNMRSWDVFLGGPFNLASYGLLLSILCEMLDMVPGQLIVNSADTHLYLNHLDAVNEFLSTSHNSQYPNVKFNKSLKGYNSIIELANNLEPDDIVLEGYNPVKTIKAPLSN